MSFHSRRRRATSRRDLREPAGNTECEGRANREAAGFVGWGYGDGVDARPEWRGSRDTHARHWALWLALASLAHLPLTPLAALLGLLTVLSQDPEGDQGPLQPVTGIPVELLDEEEGQEQAGVGVPAEPEAAAPDVFPVPVPEPSAQPPRPAPAERPDAGIEDAGVADAGAEDAGTEGTGADAGADADADVDAADAGTSRRPIGNRIGLKGSEGVADPNANVRLKVDVEKLRAHPLAPRVGAILKNVYQWRDFFGPTGLDPVRDIDRMIVWGPQFRDSSEVGAVIQHNVGAARMHAAIDALVERDAEHGAWLPDAGVPIARAQADRASRYFVLTTPRLVVVVPETAVKSVQGVKSPLPPLPDGEVAWAYLATPWRALRGLPLQVPQSIKWVRLTVVALVHGGVHIALEGEDESAELAADHAPVLERQLVAITQLDLGILGAILGARPQRFVERISLRAEGARLVGEADLTNAQLLNALDMAQLMLTPRPRPSARPRDAGPDASPHPPR